MSVISAGIFFDRPTDHPFEREEVAQDPEQVRCMLWSVKNRLVKLTRVAQLGSRKMAEWR